MNQNSRHMMEFGARAMATTQTAQVTVVCGPPGSGKTTYVQQHREHGDLIIDVDALFEALTFNASRDHLEIHLPFVCEARDAVLKRLLYAHRVPRVWIIECGASAARRNALRQQFGAKVIVLEVPTEECLRRIADDSTRHFDPKWQQLVDAWWVEYRPLSDDLKG